MSDFSDITTEARWYVAHTYSGYENKVKANLEKIIENRQLHHMIMDIRIPVEITTEPDGKDENGNPLKEWCAIAEYLDEMDGEIDGRYAETDGRKVVYKSLNPVDLVRNANVFTYAVIAIAVILVAAIVLIVRAVVKKSKKKKAA